MYDFVCGDKTKQVAFKTLRVWPKNEENFEHLHENFDIFDQNLYGKFTFSQFFPKYFLDFWLRSESIDLWKITSDFYNNFSDFGGGSSPLPLGTPLVGLVEMDKNPKWNHASYKEMSDAHLDWYFSTGEAAHDLQLPSNPLG